MTWRATPAGPSAVVQLIKAGGLVRYGVAEDVGISNPRYISYMASHDGPSNICQALNGGAAD
jgi:hypothetical protein